MVIFCMCLSLAPWLSRRPQWASSMTSAACLTTWPTSWTPCWSNSRNLISESPWRHCIETESEGTRGNPPLQLSLSFIHLSLPRSSPSNCPSLLQKKLHSCLFFFFFLMFFLCDAKEGDGATKHAWTEILWREKWQDWKNGLKDRIKNRE